MLTDQDEQWLQHLSTTHKVKIIPYNPKVKEIFEKQKEEIKSILGKDIEVVLKGAVSLEIPGKGELDIYIPVSVECFDNYLEKLVTVYGIPGRLYPNLRARFNRKIEKTEVEIFLINKASPDWIKGNIFEKYLKSHPSALKEYIKLKEKSKGLNTRGYYKKKLEFYNMILEKASK